jgi:hypothetical protein
MLTFPFFTIATASTTSAAAAPQKWMPLTKLTQIKVTQKGSKPIMVDGIMRITGSIGERQPLEQLPFYPPLILNFNLFLTFSPR